MKQTALLLLLLTLFGLVAVFAPGCTTHGVSGRNYSGWPEYLGGPDRNHYSTLSQITPDNVSQLQVAWTYSTPDSGQMQVNPIVVDGILYGVTNTVQAFALDAATGKEIWRFGDPLNHPSSTSRGVAYWSGGNDHRILYTAGSFLYALDARTGQPISTFGNNGKVDLHEGLGEQAREKFVISNTPGTIFEDLIIMPVRLSEDVDAAPGDLRAFDVRTGQLVWSFHTIPHPGETGYETWPEDAWKNTDVGGANNWAGMSVDRERGLLFVPTGSAAFDFYGGNRKGQNLYANCLLALDARTGKRIWHYQFVHHDIWDRDLPAPPNLIQVQRGGKTVDAVAQITKAGFVFVFERETGKPLFDIREENTPASAIPGEWAWPSQPIPVKPEPFARQTLTENELSPYAENKEEILAQFRKIKKGRFEPPSKEGTLMLPGFDGGGEWGGAAADPQEGILYVNSNEMAWILTIVDRAPESALAHLSPGARVYAERCAACHGERRQGNPQSGYPTLSDIGQRRDEVFVTNMIRNGKGMMPGVKLGRQQEQALVDFLFNKEKTSTGQPADAVPRPYVPYTITGYNKFLDSKGLPAIAPPWGTLQAIDLNTGEYRWKIPLGETPSLKAKGIPTTGSENYGGPVVTANGLLFIAATKDGILRAFDKKTGKLLWENPLPAASFATPAMYEVNGKQYLVLACGGAKLGTPKGNKYVAFALP